MGKNWRGGKGKGKGGAGGGGGNDLASCRGLAAVMCTCDTAREKESNKELTNLLNQAIESLGIEAEKEEEIQSSAFENESAPAVEDSVAAMLQNELQQVRDKKNSFTQTIVSINTGIKGLVLAKIKRKDVCPVQLVKTIFDRVRDEKLPVSRHLVRLIPLQLVFHPKEDELISSLKLLVETELQKDIHYRQSGSQREGVVPSLVQLAASQSVLMKRKAESAAVDIEETPKAPSDIINATALSVPNEGQTLGIADEDVIITVDSTATTSNRNTGAAVPPETVTNEDENAPNHLQITDPILERDQIQEQELLQDSNNSASVHQKNSNDISVPAPEILQKWHYFVLFKARNHNTLTKQLILQKTRHYMPSFAKQDYINGKSAVIVEAFQNIGGISYVPDYSEYNDLNLRKYQATVQEGLCDGDKEGEKEVIEEKKEAANNASSSI